MDSKKLQRQRSISAQMHFIWKIVGYILLGHRGNYERSAKNHITKL
jgi:hypothetical protein